MDPIVKQGEPAPPSVPGQRRLWRRIGRIALVGPHAYFDLVRMARKGRTILLRVLFLLALLGGLAYTYEEERLLGMTTADAQDAPEGRLNRMGRFNARCVYTFFALQNLAILVLTPAYVGGAIAEERERGTLELLFTSALHDREIVLGKLLARLLHLGGFLVAGLPVLFLMQVWGGVDAAILLSHWTFSLLLLIAVASASLMLSTLPTSPTTCVVVSYAFLLPSGLCCLAICAESDGTANPWADPGLLTLLAVLAATVFCLITTIYSLRGDADLPAREEIHGLVELRHTKHGTELAVAYGLVTVPVTVPVPDEAPHRPLPPVRDAALLWKECHSGGRSPLELREVQFIASFVLTLWAFGLAMAAVATIGRETPHSYAALARVLSGQFGPMIYAFYLATFAGYAIEAAFRAAASVVRERQRHTLDLLLLLPVDRAEILRAKAVGALVRGWPWLAVLAADVAVGLLVGTFHPLTALYLVLLPCALVAFLCAGGLLVSVLADTVLKANVIVAGALVGLAVLAWRFGIAAAAIDASLVHSCWDGPRWPTPDALRVVGGTSAALALLAGMFFFLAAAVFRRR